MESDAARETQCEDVGDDPAGVEKAPPASPVTTAASSGDSPVAEASPASAVNAASSGALSPAAGLQPALGPGYIIEASTASAVNAASSGGASSPAAAVSVIVGTSRMMAEDKALPRRIADMVNGAYGYRRLSEAEACERLAMGDAGVSANRVLHLARTKEGALLGCCSSTVQPPWTGSGCGHWGLMVVDVAAQGTGVGSDLVRAAEERLRAAGCREVQIEYEYTAGDPASERLMQWYETRLGFSGGGRRSLKPGQTDFRRLRRGLGDAEVARASRRSGAAAAAAAPA
eukprot:CAMPEP_0183597160 /NCGR_PEP_ID=MMETSP0371-20130417/176434_1 /TAXON_ID=268820 /ORGANISM="Peridinium aciculiferum, Strain PAER-2" /LENGTH=286 /DNA_ID=CAMNT_0025809103 /DNA_START=42 /DNA_END=899 /DNA_ORIENTATION=+